MRLAGKVVLGILVVAVAIGPSGAETRRWDAGGDGTDWFDPDNWNAWERENPEVLGMLAAMKPGAAQVKAIGMSLYQSRGANAIDDWRERREALMGEALRVVESGRFGVQKS